ncbi:hypothetical protein DSECCO2_639940 [anaerobic digester metagenome]
MVQRADFVPLSLVGVDEALDAFNRSCRGSVYGSIAASGAGEAAAVLMHKAKAVVMAASVIGASLGEANFAAVALGGPVSGED